MTPVLEIEAAQDSREAVPHHGSFRDPSGYVFKQHGRFFRAVSLSYKEDYDLLTGSGLYDELVEKRLLIPHTEVAPETFGAASYKVLQPEQIAYCSYPYEWCFSQMRDAALATLQIQRLALERGMSLKDARADNIQFHDGAPILIDTLSLEKLEPREPWVAYRQFCSHFLGPLALMSYGEPKLNLLQRVFLDGLPLELVSRTLPLRAWCTPFLLLHLHLHARAQGRRAGGKKPPLREVSEKSRLGLIASLESAVTRLSQPRERSFWQDYYEEMPKGYLEHKEASLKSILAERSPGVVWDLGANTGRFSEICAERGISTIAFEQDHACVELIYNRAKKHNLKRLLPLVMNLTNPSPGLGWRLRERSSWTARGGPDLVIAVALIHHLAIANNLPLSKLASFFKEVGPALVVEFVPKSDRNAKRLLEFRKDIFTGYTRENFEHEFGKAFRIVRRIQLDCSERSLYLMERRAD